MQYQQHFLIEGKHYGTALRGSVTVHAELQPPDSLAYFCPVCAEVWARCPVETGRGTIPFHVLTMPCRHHPTHGLAVPGSLWINWDGAYTDHFPENVVRWELERHLEFIKES